MALGLLLSRGITHWPILCWYWWVWWCCGAITCLLTPKWNLFATVLLIAVLMLPFMAIDNQCSSFWHRSSSLRCGFSHDLCFGTCVFPWTLGQSFPVLRQRRRWSSVGMRPLEWLSLTLLCVFLYFSNLWSVTDNDVYCIVIVNDYVREIDKVSAFLISNGIGGLLAIAAFSNSFYCS